MSSAQPRIAIIGGGPAGLTLGGLLYRHNVPFTIYELRPRPTEAELLEPSGMLDLHDESGLAAIRACGLYHDFLPYTADCEESMMIRNKAGALLHEDKGGISERPEIARNNLSRLLLSVLPEQGRDVIQYGHKLLSATRNDSTGEVTLEFTVDGKTVNETYDLVVGADGAWSRIRPLVSPAKPDLSDLSYFQLYVKNVTIRYPAIAERVGKGSMICMGDRHVLAIQRGTQDAMQMYVFVNNARAGQQAVDALTALATIPEQKERLLADDQFFGEFGEPMKEVLRVAFDEEAAGRGENGRLEHRTLVMLPAGHSWEHKSGVTLIGDAAHVMTPFAGEGVNLAMRDALELSEVIVKAYQEDHENRTSFRTTLSPLVRDFEGEMCGRAKEFSQESYDNMVMQTGDDGAEKMAMIMSTIYEAHEHGDNAEGEGGKEGGRAHQVSMSLEAMYEKITAKEK